MDQYLELKALLENATQGEWRAEADMRADEHHRPFDPERKYLAGWNIVSDAGEVVGIEGIIAGGNAEHNAALIAAAKSQLPSLLDELERLRGALEWINGQAEEAMAVTAGCASTHGDPGGGLEIANLYASDIAINARLALGREVRNG